MDKTDRKSLSKVCKVSANVHLDVWKIYIRRYSLSGNKHSQTYKCLKSENSILEISISSCYYCSLKRANRNCISRGIQVLNFSSTNSDFAKNISLDRNNVFIIEYNEICDG